MRSNFNKNIAEKILTNPVNSTLDPLSKNALLEDAVTCNEILGTKNICDVSNQH